jgi:hypothetical protein
MQRYLVSLVDVLVITLPMKMIDGTVLILKLNVLSCLIRDAVQFDLQRHSAEGNTLEIGEPESA